MPVYIDNMEASFGRMKMCHMGADSTEELLSMVDRIGVQRKWIQYPGTWKEHFDICISKRAKAVVLGAQEVTMYEFVNNQIRKRNLLKGEDNGNYQVVER
jgi:hypothetical protein